jgi:hypothetical protein
MARAPPGPKQPGDIRDDVDEKGRKIAHGGQDREMQKSPEINNSPGTGSGHRYTVFPICIVGGTL